MALGYRSLRLLEPASNAGARTYGYSDLGTEKASRANRSPFYMAGCAAWALQVWIFLAG
jgi:hypothetical protein